MLVKRLWNSKCDSVGCTSKANWEVFENKHIKEAILGKFCRRHADAMLKRSRDAS